MKIVDRNPWIITFLTTRDLERMGIYERVANTIRCLLLFIDYCPSIDGHALYNVNSIIVHYSPVFE